MKKYIILCQVQTTSARNIQNAVVSPQGFSMLGFIIHLAEEWQASWKKSICSNKGIQRENKM